MSKVRIGFRSVAPRYAPPNEHGDPKRAMSRIESVQERPAGIPGSWVLEGACRENATKFWNGLVTLLFRQWRGETCNLLLQVLQAQARKFKNSKPSSKP